MKRILLTGGGSSGHVTPNLALIPKLQEAGYEVHYIGAKDGIEQEIIERIDIPFYAIYAGKLRRYFSWKNFTDVFRILYGTYQAYRHIRNLRPQVVFSKGGFVSCPVVWAAWLHRLPILIHESDITPGLANRLATPFARKICITFPESTQYVPKNKSILTGLPLRTFITSGDPTRGKEFCNFAEDKPVILVIGGSQGANAINEAVRTALPELSKSYQIIHLCGKGKIDTNYQNHPTYRQYEYINDELPDLFALADIIISRAGSTTINEIKALKKVNLLIPLPKSSSRGDQILNARSFEKQGLSLVLEEENLTPQSLLHNLTELNKNQDHYRTNLNKTTNLNSVDLILREIQKLHRIK